MALEQFRSMLGWETEPSIAYIPISLDIDFFKFARAKLKKIIVTGNQFATSRDKSVLKLG